MIRQVASRNGQEGRSLRIAVTSQNRRTITGHAGQCRRFLIFSVQDGLIGEPEMLELPREASFHNSSGGDPHPLAGVDVLITGGMGRGLVGRLRRMSIQPVITAVEDPRQAVTEFLDGSLEILPLPEAPQPAATVPPPTQPPNAGPIIPVVTRKEN